MNKSLEKICEEKAHKYGREKIMQSCVGLPTWPHDYSQGFKDAISTLRCENCRYACPYGLLNLGCERLDLNVTKDFGCIEFEKRRAGNDSVKKR